MTDLARAAYDPRRRRRPRDGDGVNFDRVWREPPVETEDYPGLVVHDARVTGSITAGRSRLPLWAFIADVVRRGWASAEHGYEPSRYGWGADRMARFLYALLEHRGEFGRLICVLADVERRDFERDDTDDGWWFKDDVQRARLAAQLRRCLEALEEQP